MLRHQTKVLTIHPEGNMNGSKNDVATHSGAVEEFQSGPKEVNRPTDRSRPPLWLRI